MTDAEILTLLKSNLNITHTAQDTFLAFLIDASKEALGGMGITLDVDASEDINLIVMHAAYLFRKRAEDNPVIPRMLQYAIHNRLFGEKAR